MTTAPVSINQDITTRATNDKFVIKDCDRFDEAENIVKVFDKEDAKKLAEELLKWANS
jgi:hypothetical protein